MSVVETIHLNSIEELHEFLSPVGSQKQFFTEEKRFLFRGEGSDRYPLNPSLLRGNTIESLYASLRLAPIDKRYFLYEETYQWIELKTLVKFFRLANNAGVSLPDTDILKTNVLRLSEGYVPESHSWLPEELLDLFSLARHYSFPTRMIDWSDNIYTALYFACSTALEQSFTDFNDGLVVYILNLSAIQQTDFPIRFVRPLRSYNEKAQAQGGVLSYIERETLILKEEQIQDLPSLDLLSDKRVEKTPLDVLLTNHFESSSNDQNTLLTKVVINKTIIKDLYLYLDSLHYSAEKIHPDLYGVVQKMLHDEVNWTNHPHSDHRQY